MSATTGAPDAKGLASCWAVLNHEQDPMRGFWDLRLALHERRFFLRAASLPDYLESLSWNELKAEQKQAIRSTAARVKRWVRNLEERGL